MSTTASPAPANELTAAETTVLRLLQSGGGRMRASALLSRIPADDPEAVIHTLAEQGLVDTHYTLVPPNRTSPCAVCISLGRRRDDRGGSAAPGQAIQTGRCPARPGPSRRCTPYLAELCELAGCSEGPVRALFERGWVESTNGGPGWWPCPGRSRPPERYSGPLADLRRAPKQAEALSALLERGGRVDLQRFLDETGLSRQ